MIKSFVPYLLLIGLLFSLAINSKAYSQVKSEGAVSQEATTLEPTKESKEASGNESSMKTQAETDLVESPRYKAENSAPVTFREKMAFQLFFKDKNEQEGYYEKARIASQAMERALTAESPAEAEAPEISFSKKDKQSIELRVRGFKITDLTMKEAQAAGFENIQDYADQLESQLSAFVAEELQRLKIQEGALKFFLSIFFGLMGFIILRQAHIGFNKAENVLDEKRDSFESISFLSETLLSGQAVGGLLAFSLALGRMFAYLVVVLSTAAAILGQFSFTRTIMGSFFARLLKQILEGFQSLVEAIPGLLLALTLIFIFQLALKVLDLFLKGVRSGRVHVSVLSPERAPVLRFWGSALLAILFFPFILASIFGKFSSPLEFVFLVATGTLALATLPILISVAAGSFVLWQGLVKPGEWVEVGDTSGEITDISISKLTLVPANGGRVHVPMILLLFKSCFEKEAPRFQVQLRVTRNGTLEEMKTKVNELFPGNFSLSVSCLSISREDFLFCLRAPLFKAGLKDEIMTIISTANDKGLFEVRESFVKEEYH